MPQANSVIGNMFSYSDLLGKALKDRQDNNHLYANLIAHGKNREANQFLPMDGSNFNYLGQDEDGNPVYDRQVQQGIGYQGNNTSEAYAEQQDAFARQTEKTKKLYDTAKKLNEQKEKEKHEEIGKAFYKDMFP
jgi:hypothetical protein